MKPNLPIHFSMRYKWIHFVALLVGNFNWHKFTDKIVAKWQTDKEDLNLEICHQVINCIFPQ